MKHFKRFLCVVLTLLLIVPGGLAEDMALALNTEETGASFEGDVSSVSANNDDGAAADEDVAFSISPVDSDVAEAGEMDLPADDGDVGALSVQADYTDAPSASTVTYCFIALDTLVASRTAAEGEEIAAPDAPAAPEGMVFAGWALEDGTAVFADDTPVIAHTDPIISEINVIAKFAAAEVPAAPAAFAPSDEDTGPEEDAGAAGDASVSDNTEPVVGPGEGSAPAAADETAPVAADETEPGADDDPEADADVGTDGNGEEGGDADQEDADAANDADAEKEDESAKDAGTVNNADAEKDAEEEGNENAGVLEDDPAEGEPNGDEASDEDSDEASGEAGNEDGDEASGEDGGEDGDEDGDEDGGEASDEAGGDAEAALQPIRVVFNITPADAVVTVKALDSETGEAAEEQPDDAQPADETPDGTSENTDASITAQDDGSFALLPGAYTYTASAEGYKPAQDVPFTVAVDALTIDIALEAEAEVSDEESADGAEAEEAQEAEEADGAEEYPPFDQSATCNGVVVAVKADAGTFPAGAALHVSRVLLYEQRQADAAVDEVRDENMTVASSYTFDIKVLDDAGNELQPADGHAVSVSFSVDTVADENLTTTIYHIEEEGGSYTAALLETVEDGDTASAETDGFSVYTVEFAYENKTYSMAGGGSESLSRILEGLGFVGVVTEVTVSNEELFEAMPGGQGEWVIKSKQPLSSEESMKVVIDGQEYMITVTDYWEPVSYIDENGQEKQISEYSLVQSSDEPITWTGWYVLDDNTTIPERITVSGEAHLILCPRRTLTAVEGITVAAGNTLNIYAQSTSEGQNVKGVLYSGASGTPAYCAGIGGYSGACGTVNIIGGEIHANGGPYGAGIGGGNEGADGTVNIIGGEIYATGGLKGAGIGGGNEGAGGTVNIIGGKVTATGGQYGAGIGGG